MYLFFKMPSMRMNLMSPMKLQLLMKTVKKYSRKKNQKTNIKNTLAKPTMFAKSTVKSEIMLIAWNE
jgi:hypothetical protein